MRIWSQKKKIQFPHNLKDIARHDNNVEVFSKCQIQKQSLTLRDIVYFQVISNFKLIQIIQLDKLFVSV